MGQEQSSGKTINISKQGEQQPSHPCRPPIYEGSESPGNEDLSRDASVHSGKSKDDDDIIKVVGAPFVDDDLDDDLKRLSEIPQFGPLIQESERLVVQLEHFLGISSKFKSKEKPVSDRNDLLSFDPQPLIEILGGMQKHIGYYMHTIHHTQQGLLQRIKYADELGLRSAHTMAVAVNQARAAADRLAEVKALKRQAEQARQGVSSIFNMLRTMEHHLEPADRIGHEAFTERWPVLAALCAPPIEGTAAHVQDDQGLPNELSTEQRQRSLSWKAESSTQLDSANIFMQSTLPPSDDPIDAHHDLEPIYPTRSISEQIMRTMGVPQILGRYRRDF